MSENLTGVKVTSSKRRFLELIQKGTKHGKEHWTVFKYIMQQTHRLLNMFKNECQWSEGKKVTVGVADWAQRKLSKRLNVWSKAFKTGWVGGLNLSAVVHKEHKQSERV